MATLDPRQKTQPVSVKPVLPQNGVANQNLATAGMGINEAGGQPLQNAMQPPPITGNVGAPPTPYTPQQPPQTYKGSGGSSYGGVSATNPQANMLDYNSLKRFEDAAYNQAMQRLNPQLEQQGQAFDQAMVNQGIPIGSEAYQRAKQQLDFNQNDARSSAAFNAMGFGRDTQNQMFGQDLARSQLANSLLQAKWGKDLGFANLNQQGDMFNRTMNEQGRQFDNTFGEGQRQFNDLSNRAWDQQGFGQMMNLDANNFRNQAYNDSRSDYGDSLLMSLLGYGGGSGNVWNADPNQAYSSQLGYTASTGNNRMSNMTNLFGGLMGGW